MSKEKFSLDKVLQTETDYEEIVEIMPDGFIRPKESTCSYCKQLQSRLDKLEWHKVEDGLPETGEKGKLIEFVVGTSIYFGYLTSDTEDLYWMTPDHDRTWDLKKVTHWRYVDLPEGVKE